MALVEDELVGQEGREGGLVMDSLLKGAEWVRAGRGGGMAF